MKINEKIIDLKITGHEIIFVCEVKMMTINGKPLFLTDNEAIYQHACHGQDYYKAITLESCRTKSVVSYQRLGTFNSDEVEVKDGFAYFKEGRIRRKLVREENGVYVLREKAEMISNGKWSEYHYDDSR